MEHSDKEIIDILIDEMKRTTCKTFRKALKKLVFKQAERYREQKILDEAFTALQKVIANPDGLDCFPKSYYVDTEQRKIFLNPGDVLICEF